MTIDIQEQGFDPGRLQRSLMSASGEEGAVVTFTGHVRNDSESRKILSMELEHYPGMTQQSIKTILEEAQQRWPLLRVHVVHRVGELYPGEPIVWVGVTAEHRASAFSACEFIMDYLKTRAPFWKKERTNEGDYWVDSRDSDADRAERW
ncbi:MAG: molybdopterin synthase catalytic subunit MoaE [Pseudomonadota bacterium]